MFCHVNLHCFTTFLLQTTKEHTLNLRLVLLLQNLNHKTILLLISEKKKKVVSLLNHHTSGFLFSAFKLIFFLLACEEPDEYFDSMPKSEMAPAAAEKLSGQETCDNILITDKIKASRQLFHWYLLFIIECVYICVCVYTINVYK